MKILSQELTSILESSLWLKSGEEIGLEQNSVDKGNQLYNHWNNLDMKS